MAKLSYDKNTTSRLQSNNVIILNKCGFCGKLPYWHSIRAIPAKERGNVTRFIYTFCKLDGTVYVGVHLVYAGVSKWQIIPAWPDPNVLLQSVEQRQMSSSDIEAMRIHT